jgi:hypothetical protein
LAHLSASSAKKSGTVKWITVGLKSLILALHSSVSLMPSEYPKLSSALMIGSGIHGTCHHHTSTEGQVSTPRPTEPQPPRNSTPMS